jgi:hypothetical protein
LRISGGEPAVLTGTVCQASCVPGIPGDEIDNFNVGDVRSARPWYQERNAARNGKTNAYFGGD